MKPYVEIVVSANTSTAVSQGGILDLFGDEEINLVFSVKDYKDITSVNSYYSQNFQVPGTKNNNQIFSHLFLIGSDGLSFDPRKKALCEIRVDSQTVIVGTIQIVSMDISDRDKPIYSMTVFGATKEFNSKIKGRYLTDYDFSELNHILSINNIQATWSGNSNNGYYYSLKDYGYDYTLTGVKSTTTKAGIPIGNWFPDIYNKYILDKIFSGAGFSYSSNLLSSTTFTETVIPYNRDPSTIMGTEYQTGRTFTATATALSSITYAMMTINPQQTQPYYYEFIKRINANQIQSGSSVGANYTSNINGDTYTFDQNGISSFDVTINYQYNVVGSPLRSQVGAQFFRSGYYGGAIPFYSDLSVEEVAGTQSRTFRTPVCDSYTQVNNAGGNPLRPFAAGEQVWVKIHLVTNQGYVAAAGTPWQITAGGITWRHYPSASRAPGQTVTMNNIVPEKILVTDYLKSIFNMFNIYVEPSKTIPNQLILESFEDYYAGGTARDWSTKLDRSQKITETLISEELSKKYTFTYKSDSDFLNQTYTDSQKRVYGDWYYDTDNDFVTTESKVELIFSPTPVDNINGSTKFVIPKIGKYDSNGKYNKTSSNIRFLRKNPTPLTLPAGEVWGFTGNTNYTTYPYAGHLNNPFTGNIDYNFGSVPFVFYPYTLGNTGSTLGTTFTENNLVNQYWKKYLDEVTDKDARIIKCYVKLTPADIAILQLRDTVYIDGLTSEGGNTYRIASVTYNVTSNKPSLVELIKVQSKYTSRFASRNLFYLGNGSVLFNGGGTGLVLGSAKLNKGNTVAIGDGSYNGSETSLLIGNGTILNGFSDGSHIVGDFNTIAPANTGTTVFGSFNTINSVGNGKSTIIGDTNTIDTGSTSVYLHGSNNNIQLGNKIRVFGSSNSININAISATSENIIINGDSNVTYGLSTGVTVDGTLNSVYAGGVRVKIVGDSNTFSGSTGSTIYGYSNTLTNVSRADILGDSNVITGGANQLIKGNANVIGNSYSNVIFGDTNSINYSTGSQVLGTGNTVLNSDLAMVQGNNNYVHTAATNVTIFGTGNIVHSGATDVVIYGNSNTVFTAASETVIYGDSNTVYQNAINTNIIGNTNIVQTGATNISINNVNNIDVGTSNTVYSQNNYIYDLVTLASGSSIVQAGGTAAGESANAFGSGGTASGNFSFVTGVDTTAPRFAEIAHSSNGDYGQFGSVMFAGISSAASTSELFLNVNTNTSRFVLSTGQSYYCKIKAVGVDFNGVSSSGNSASFEGSVMIKNSTGTTALVGSSILTQVFSDGPLSATSLTLSADTINNALHVRGNSPGPAMTWTVEMNYVMCAHKPY